MYEYRATVIRVIDGDTVDCRVDVGFRVSIDMRFRLAGINAPEMDTEAGKAAKVRLMELMPQGIELLVRTQKDRQEKYGRYLGTFLDLDGHSINDRMFREGHAVLVR